jgi:hypothetical protein
LLDNDEHIQAFRALTKMGETMNNEVPGYAFAFLFCAGLGLTSFVLWRFFSALRSPDAEAKRKARFAVIYLIVAIAGTLVAARLYKEVDLRTGDAGRFATRNGRTIQLHPSGITFQVPQDWLEWDTQFHNNFHLSHRELRSVRIAHGEWDSEYSSVVNASLPFEHCAAHVGDDGWGGARWIICSFAGTSLCHSLSADDVLLMVKTQSFGVAQSIAAEQGYPAELTRFSTSTEQGWQKATITYPLWYGDYGGTASIDFYVKNVGHYRLVLVFMGPGFGENEKSRFSTP